MDTFKDFIESGNYIKLDQIGDSIDVIVAKDPFTLKPRAGNFIDQTTKQPRLVFDYVLKDMKGNEKIFTNGSQSFARSMARLVVGDKARIIKVEKNGKGVYVIRKLEESGKIVDEPEDDSIPVIEEK